MRARLILYSCLTFALLFGAACKTTETGDKTSRDRYAEDLSRVRKEYDQKEQEVEQNSEDPADTFEEVEIEGSINDRLSTVYDTLKRRQGDNPVVQGFTVQVYAGPSRNAANDAKEKVYKTILNVSPELEYIQPNFKVKVGRFIDRLEAQKMYAQLREEFPQALIIPEKIYLR